MLIDGNDGSGKGSGESAFSATMADLQTQTAQAMQIRADSQMLLLKSLILINGGGVVALLTYLGSTGGKHNFDINTVKLSLGYFIIGIGLAIAAFQFQFHQYGAKIVQLELAKERLKEEIYNNGKKIKSNPEKAQVSVQNAYIFIFILIALASAICFSNGATSALDLFVYKH